MSQAKHVFLVHDCVRPLAPVLLIPLKVDCSIYFS